MGENFFRLRLFDDIVSELSNAVLKTQPLLREVNDVLISYSGSRMRRLCSSYSAAGTAGHGYSRLLYWIPDSTNGQWKRSPNNPMFDVSKQYQICIMALRLSDYISIFVLVFFFVMRDNGILKNFQFCPLSLGFMVEFWYNQRISKLTHWNACLIPGPLSFPESLDVRRIPFSQARQLTIALTGMEFRIKSTSLTYYAPFIKLAKKNSV